MTRAGHEVTVFPALVDEGATVGLGVFGSADEEEARHRLGVRRLLLLGLGALRSRVDCDGLSTGRRSSASPGRRTPPSPSCSRTAGPPSCRALVDAAPAGADAGGSTTRCWPPRPTAPDARCARCGRVLRVLDALAAGRQGAQRPRGHGDAAGARGHEGAARAAGARRASSARRAPSSCAAIRPTSPR